MACPDGVAATYDLIARDFDRTRSRPWPTVVSFIDSLPGGSFVVDIGCGNGRHTMSLSNRGHRTVGADISTGLLAISHEKLDGLPGVAGWTLADARNLPFRTGTFDAALCIATLHHIDSAALRRRALEEASRVMRPGGRLLVSAWDFDQPRFAILRRGHGEEGWPGFGDVQVPWHLPDGRVVERYYHLFTAGDFSAAVSDCPLNAEKVWTEGGNHYAVLVKP